MSRLTLAAAAAALIACAAPAVAQDVAPAAPAVTAAPAMSPEETAFEAKGQAFDAESRQMGVEL